MCLSCVTTFDAVAVNAVIAGSFGVTAFERVRDRLVGRAPGERRREIHAANAALLESMGLDPAEVLGPAPTPEPVPPRRAFAAVGRSRLRRRPLALDVAR